MPKRKGYILEQIADWDNLELAVCNSQKGGKVKRNTFIRKFNENKQHNLMLLQVMILTLDFPKPIYKLQKRVVDSGKERDIILADYFPWHILDHAVMQVINEDINKNLIYDTYSSVKGRGTTLGVQRLKKFIRLNKEYKFFVKTDFKKFYESINHELVMTALNRKYKDKKFLYLMDNFILNYNSDIEEVFENEKEKRIANRTLYVTATS